jgi:hypothetical protein
VEKTTVRNKQASVDLRYYTPVGPQKPQAPADTKARK